MTEKHETEDPLDGEEEEAFVVDTHGEPDEPGEGPFLRRAPDGGVEARVLSDRSEPSLADQMASEEDFSEDVRKWRALRGKGERRAT